MQEFVRTNRQVVWSAEERESAYGLIERVLKGQQYRLTSICSAPLRPELTLQLDSLPICRDNILRWNVYGITQSI
jgi:hypothetical protein